MHHLHLVLLLLCFDVVVVGLNESESEKRLVEEGPEIFIVMMVICRVACTVELMLLLHLLVFNDDFIILDDRNDDLLDSTTSLTGTVSAVVSTCPENTTPTDITASASESRRSACSGSSSHRCRARKLLLGRLLFHLRHDDATRVDESLSELFEEVVKGDKRCLDVFRCRSFIIIAIILVVDFLLQRFLDKADGDDVLLECPHDAVVEENREFVLLATSGAFCLAVHLVLLFERDRRENQLLHDCRHRRRRRKGGEDRSGRWSVCCGVASSSVVVFFSLLSSRT